MNIMLHEKRFLATLIDAALGVALSLIFSLLLKDFFSVNFMNYDYYYVFMFTITMFIYQLFCLLIFKKHTLGLYLMSLKILNNDWEIVKFKNAFLRSITISIPILFIINLLYMAIYRTDTTLFDDISDTMVVNTGDNYHVNPKLVVERIKYHKK